MLIDLEQKYIKNYHLFINWSSLLSYRFMTPSFIEEPLCSGGEYGGVWEMGQEQGNRWREMSSDGKFLNGV